MDFQCTLLNFVLACFLYEICVQAFHLSQNKTRVTYISADTENQHCHDSFSSNHAIAAAPSREIADAHSSEQKTGQLKPTPGSTGQAAADEGSPRYGLGMTQEQGMSDVSIAIDRASCPGKASLEKDSKKAAACTVADALSDADLRKMLAVHSRTQRRAQSLIDKVHALKTDCRALLHAMPADILSTA
jgi:hypothetical protein